MLYKLPSSQSPVYQKAKDIFALARRISDYFQHDLAALRKDGNESPGIYFTGDVVQKTVRLFPEIINAEQKTSTTEKIKHATSVSHLTQQIYHSCMRLEKSLTNGKEFVEMFRKELKRFQKLQKKWRLTL